MRASSLLVALVGASAAAAAPQRVVSMNPCADAILAEVAAPGQIAAVSHWSHDPRGTSMDLARARRFPRHFGTAEEVLRLAPDLVVAGAHTPAATRAAFARLGVPVVTVGVPASVADSLAEVRALARAVGRPAAGEALVGRIERALAAARHQGPPVPAVLRTPAGVVPGDGTLMADLMATTGFVNAAATMGLARWDVLPVERLLLAPPVLLLADPGAALHPALARARVRVAPFDMRLLNCGGPSIIRAAAALAAIRRGLP
ncbi:ABC transporter substrate-binding protein [Thermaurantiacus tibetensis]|uniref:ABC transporter substrate-binding protein n=1 Tax=Thermaurantiacus tibetensis TaxID=2759035 RepID=UPI002E29328A|nr:ABC transporter substrate-binding protein [Thermaurantiacus tibetensis]